MDTEQPQFSNEVTPAAPTNGSVIALLAVLAVLLVAVVGLGAYIWYGMSNTPADEVVVEEIAAPEPDPAEGGYTTEEKAAILSSLRKNPAGLSTEEKRAKLQALSGASNNVDAN
ncbi:hypothetical protein CL655_01380 [bacterium]|nr:hypothetical protein [bacterium]|tara:strand:- start:1963 stop:2304 length:342 start_codon:yes stop_codon:yes gene_type:complete